MLRIGALTRHARAAGVAARSATWRRCCTTPSGASRTPIVRNRGTVGGSVCQADPSEDLSGAFCALRADSGDPRRAGDPHGADAGVLPRALPDGGGARARCSSSCACRCGRRAAPTSRSTGGRATGRSPRPPPRSGVADGVITDAGIGLTAVGPFVAAEAEASLLRAAADRGDVRRGRAARRAALPSERRPARARRLQAPPRGRADRCAHCATRGGEVTGGARRRQRAGRAPRRRAAAAARAPPPRRARAHRHPLGLRHVQLRGLRGVARRRAGEVLHRARRDGRRPHRAHGGGAGPAGRPRPGAARVHRLPRPAVRVLHPGDAAHRPLAARPHARPDRGGDPHGHRGHHLPLHRLREHRQGDPAGGRHEPRRRAPLSGGADRASVGCRARRTPRFVRGRGRFVDDIAPARACCTPRCCAARTPAPGSSPSTRSPPSRTR